MALCDAKSNGYESMCIVHPLRTTCFFGYHWCLRSKNLREENRCLLFLPTCEQLTTLNNPSCPSNWIRVLARGCKDVKSHGGCLKRYLRRDRKSFWCCNLLFNFCAEGYFERSRNVLDLMPSLRYIATQSFEISVESSGLFSSCMLLSSKSVWDNTAPRFSVMNGISTTKPFSSDLLVLLRSRCLRQVSRVIGK